MAVMIAVTAALRSKVRREDESVHRCSSEPTRAWSSAMAATCLSVCTRKERSSSPTSSRIPGVSGGLEATDLLYHGECGKPHEPLGLCAVVAQCQVDFELALVHAAIFEHDPEVVKELDQKLAFGDPGSQHCAGYLDIVGHEAVV